MYEELKEALLVRVPGERVDTIIKGAHCLDNLGLSSHHHFLEEILYVDGQIDPLEYVERVEQHIMNSLDKAATSFSIYVSDANVGIYCAILDSLSQLPEYIDSDYILGLCIADEDPAIVLADISNEITGYDSNDILNAIDSVSPRLIDKIINVLEERIGWLGLAERRKGPLDRIKDRFQTYVGEDNYLIVTEIKAGRPLGQDPDLLYMGFTDELLDFDESRIADEVLAILMASNIETDNVVLKAKGFAEELFEDYHMLSKYLMAVDSFWTEFTENAKA